MNLIESILGPIELEGETGVWRIAASSETPEAGVELIHLQFSAPEAAPPPRVTLKWSVPQLDMQSRWHPACGFDRNIPPDWSEPVSSSLASSLPLMQFLNLKGENRLLIAVSDALRQVDVLAGVDERTNEIAFEVGLFSVPEAPLASIEVILRFDTRKVFYADAIRAAMAWYASFPEYAPAPVPEAAFDPIYSTWYSYHRELSAPELEAECALAARAGLKGIIVDDGWQTEDADRKWGYAFTGDWEAAKKRFPDMRAHVEKIHELGMKYILWFGVSTVGELSKNYGRFKNKLLWSRTSRRVGFLDPRFPEVREFLISIYEKALKEWDLDGFKLDFIDNFRFVGEDPAVEENYAGRDIRSLPEAVDKLLSDVMARLRAVKPEILIEFRQRYIGPAIRKYGNMFRSADCPADALTNRIHTIDLRLTSGDTAVHSDMLEWNVDDTAENAALQFLNILFSVPQISVRFAELPESHGKMLRFWLGFWIRHRDLLLHGDLRPYHPELDYPLVVAENAEEKLVAIYHAGQVAKIECAPGKTCFVVNAAGSAGVILDIAATPLSAAYFDTTGAPVPGPAVGAGLARVPVPASGLLELRF